MADGPSATAPTDAIDAVKLKPGDTVRVVGSRGTTKIRSILIGVHGALLESQIDGFRRWNLDELRLVKRKTKPPSA